MNSVLRGEERSTSRVRNHARSRAPARQVSSSRCQEPELSRPELQDEVIHLDRSEETLIPSVMIKCASSRSFFFSCWDL